MHGRVDCSPLKDRHLDAVTRCASGAEASSLLRKGDAGIDIVLVEVRSCVLGLNGDDKITGRSGICEIGLSHTARARGMEACIPLWSCVRFYGEPAGCPRAFYAFWNITRALRPRWLPANSTSALRRSGPYAAAHAQQLSIGGYHCAMRWCNRPG